MLAIDNRYLLITQTTQASERSDGQWRFRLASALGETILDEKDIEPGVSGERLALLTLVRGLEALEQESQVTLITDSRYVIRGLRYGIEEWRENGWKWDRFGEFTDINYADLWKRADNALQYHQLQCRFLRFDFVTDAPPSRVPKPHFLRRRSAEEVGDAEPTIKHRMAPRGIDRQSDQWFTAAQQIGKSLDNRWENILELA